MRPTDVFRDLTNGGGRIGFYTKETSGQIPELPGWYAWMLPLWFYREDLGELMNTVNDLLCYDPPG